MELICFDLDNTLIYSDKAHVISYNKALEKFGLKKKSFKYLTSLFGRPHNEIVEIIAPKLDKKGLSKLSELHDKIFIKEGVKYCKLILGVKETLKRIKRLGYKIAVLSNLSHKTILVALKQVKLDYNLFDLIVGNDDVKHSKPCPDEILKAEKLLHHKASYMVGDTIYDVIAGKKAKVKTIAVLTGRYNKKRLIKYKPYCLLKSVNELPKLLKRG